MAVTRLWHGDFFALRNRIPLADVAIVDPPYGTTSLKWDKWDSRLLPVLLDSIKPNGTVWLFAPLRVLVEKASELGGWEIVQDIVWAKHNGSGFINDRFRKTHETAVHLRRRGAKWSDIYKDALVTLDAKPKAVRRKKRPTHTGNIGASAYVSHDGGPRLMRSVLEVRSCHGSARHPTEKPLDLIARLIAYSCPPGGRVLDPMCGSGTTAIAARSLGRDSDIVEASDEYINVARERLASDERIAPAWSTRSAECR